MGRDSRGLNESVLAVIFTGILGYLALAFFNGLVTKADYSPEQFVKKEAYNTDIATLKTEIENIKEAQNIMGTDIKKILLEVKR